MWGVYTFCSTYKIMKSIVIINIWMLFETKSIVKLFNKTNNKYIIFGVIFITFDIIRANHDPFVNT